MTNISDVSAAINFAHTAISESWCVHGTILFQVCWHFAKMEQHIGSSYFRCSPVHLWHHSYHTSCLIVDKLDQGARTMWPAFRIWIRLWWANEKWGTLLHICFYSLVVVINTKPCMQSVFCNVSFAIPLTWCHTCRVFQKMTCISGLPVWGAAFCQAMCVYIYITPVKVVGKLCGENCNVCTRSSFKWLHK
jgi:hypothetical protein